MKQWTVGKRIVVGGCAILALLIVVATVACFNLKSIKHDSSLIAKKRVPNLAYAGLINANQCDGFLHSVLMMQARSKEQYDQFFLRSQVIVTNSNEALAGYEKNLTQPKDKEVYENFTNARKEFVATRLKYEEYSKAGQTNEAVAHFNSAMLPKFYAYLQAGAAMRDHNRDETETISQAIDNRITTTLRIIIGLSLFALIGGVAIGWSIIAKTNRILASVSGHLETSSQQLLESARMVSANSQSLAEGANEQAASLEETSASLEEMASGAAKRAEGAQKAKELLEMARTSGDSGLAEMQEMSRAMNEIKTANDGIAKIIKTIDEVAFQTNILALNAAVEAARAGESGMGFAVVADEVRNLAQRCAHAARETAGIIEDSIQKSQRGVELNDRVAHNLNDMVDKVRSAVDIAVSAADSSREQSQNLNQINTAVSQMDKTTQTTAATAEESASAAEELNAQAGALSEVVTQLATLVGNQSQSGR